MTIKEPRKINLSESLLFEDINSEEPIQIKLLESLLLEFLLI